MEGLAGVWDLRAGLRGGINRWVESSESVLLRSWALEEQKRAGWSGGIARGVREARTYEL